MKLFFAISLVLAYVCFSVFAQKAQIIPTSAVYEAAKLAINNLIDAPENRVGRDRPLIGGFVRLAFHDCVGPGSCDGCVNHTKTDNKGLEPYTDKLEVEYAAFTNTMSRADFYALASVLALERSTTDTVDKFNGLGQMKVGRRDCENSPGETSDTEEFPSGLGDFVATFGYFSTHFGFTNRETTALLGAHTLGRTRFENSGFEGPWVGGRFSTTENGPGVLLPTSTLDNAFYRMIIDQVAWNQVAIENNKKQWQQPAHPNPNDPDTDEQLQTPMLLNSDMVLSWDLDVANDGVGTVGCLPRTVTTRPGRCQHSSTDSDAVAFAADNALWISEFRAIFFKMINKNYDTTLQDAPTPSNSDASRLADQENMVDALIEKVNKLEDEIKKDTKT